MPALTPAYVFAFELAAELAVAGLRANGNGTDCGVPEPCIRGEGVAFALGANGGLWADGASPLTLDMTPSLSKH
jgi:hypothetical protein